MTVNELIAELRTIVKDNKDNGKLPVRMFSDAEGNDLHDIDFVGIDAESPSMPKPLAYILVPKHESLIEW